MDEEYIDWLGWKVRPDNVPLNRPGAYRFRNLLKNDEFVGNYIGISGIRSGIAGRCSGHPSGACKFENAVNKYGKENFLLTPICYLLSEEADAVDRFHLQIIEAEQITQFNAISNGYNIKASDGGVGPYGPEFGAIIREALFEALQDPEIRQRLVEGARRGAKTAHATKTPEGKSVMAVTAGTNAIKKLRVEKGEAAVRDLQSRGGKAATSAKDPDGKSTHARRMRAIADPHKERTADGRSVLGIRSGKAGAIALHSKVDEFGRSLAGLRWAEQWHAQKDERGKSANAVEAGKKGMASLHELKDDDGKSHWARVAGQISQAKVGPDGKTHGERMREKARQNTHKKLDVFGRSLQTLKGIHTRDHVNKGGYDLFCPFCNPDDYMNHPRVSQYMSRRANGANVRS